MRHNEEHMARKVSQAELDAVFQAVARFPEGGDRVLLDGVSS